jgi:hypothetical protein
VHACWDHDNINFLHSQLINGRLTDELIYQSVNKGTMLFTALDNTLKGREIKMPHGLYFTDKDGTNRTDIRIKWWENPVQTTYRAISIEPLPQLPDTPIDVTLLPTTDFYKEDFKPVFFGHYWLKGNPSLYRKNICCLDYSVAKQGYLVAYRFDGEEFLNADKLIYV